MNKRTCIIAECDKPVRCREVCRSHYHSFTRAGRLDELPNTPRPRRDPIERFLEKVDQTSECWQWNGWRDRYGYGLFRLDGKNVLAHRHAYEISVGPIPEGLTIDHLCRVRNCVNPDHLQPVTALENMRRRPPESYRRAGFSNVNRARRLKTHCVNGHQFTPDNTKVKPNGTRKCRACDRDHAARAYIRRKGVAA